LFFIHVFDEILLGIGFFFNNRQNLLMFLIDILIRAEVSLFSQRFLSLRIGDIGALLEAMIDLLLNKRMVFDGEIALLI